MLNRLLQHVDFNQAHYSSHNLWIWAATSAAASELPDYLFQKLDDGQVTHAIYSPVNIPPTLFVGRYVLPSLSTRLPIVFSCVLWRSSQALLIVFLCRPYSGKASHFLPIIIISTNPRQQYNGVCQLMDNSKAVPVVFWRPSRACPLLFLVCVYRVNLSVFIPLALACCIFHSASLALYGGDKSLYIG